MLRPHIPSNYFGDIPPLNHTIYLKPNWKEMAAALPVVEVKAEVVEESIVAHVVDMAK